MDNNRQYSDLRKHIASQCDDIYKKQLERIIFCSPFVADQWQRNPDWLTSFCDDKVLVQTDWQVETFAYSDMDDEESFMRKLRRWRMQNMACLAARDILQVNSTEYTCKQVSVIADQAIVAAKAYAERQVLKQARFKHIHELPDIITLGMGKLGGCELNYSSDIDLIFFYHTELPTTHVEWSVVMRVVAQLMIKYIGSVTSDGFIFRVDMRLRPFGDSGALVLSLSAAENYYTTHGRDWERYALIKARVITGSTRSQALLNDFLQPFVYRRYLDFGSLNALRDLKARIHNSYAGHTLQGNLKLGRGGIREIEFIFQLIQLTYGGKKVELQTKSIVVAAQYTKHGGLLPSSDVDDLLQAYWFLRRAENGLQMMRDRQIHHLPDDREDQLRLANIMGFAQYQNFLDSLAGYQQQVGEYFDAVLKKDTDTSEQHQRVLYARKMWVNPEDALVEYWAGQLAYARPKYIGEQLQLMQKAAVIQRMDELGRQRLGELMTAIVLALPQIPDYGDDVQEQQLWLRLHFFIKQIARRSVYMVLLSERKDVLHNLLLLCMKSAWVADSVSSHPAMLDMLLEPVVDDLSQQSVRTWLQNMFSEDTGDIEARMDSMRRYKHEMTMRVAQADLLHDLSLMRVSDTLTFMAESLLDSALRFAYESLCEQYGEPHYVDAHNQTQVAHMAVIAYGKMGGRELAYDSDLDIVFLHDSQGSKEYTRGKKCIDNSMFFARLVQKTRHYLNTFMHNGRLYEVDLRLRPNGASGTLATRMLGYQQYIRKEAWLWELQALVRARYVVGDPAVGASFERLRKEVLCQPRDRQKVQKEVRDMRLRMRKELGSKVVRNQAEAPFISIKSQKSIKFHVKQDFGGIADIEFMVQYAVLANAAMTPVLADYTDNIRLLEMLAAYGYFDTDDAQQLIVAYKLFREVLHHRSLQNMPVLLEHAELFAHAELIDAIDTVSGIWLKIMY